MSEDFHRRPFDEGTLTKLELFELYAREWLPVFLANDHPQRKEVHIFDFFAGPGKDSRGVAGSPLRLLQQLGSAQRYAGWRATSVHAHFFDSSAEKIDALRSEVAQRPSIPGLTPEIEPLEFNEALERNASVLKSRTAAKLLLIDQYGVDQITPEVFKSLVTAPTCDFLFFLSSSTLYRFRDHPAIKQKIIRPDDHYHVHRAALDYYRELLPRPNDFYLAPFSIKKGSNIYGVIFGSGHPLGMDKFLQVAWQKDSINGEADFDINRENFQPDQTRLPLEDFRPSKIAAFEAELEHALRAGRTANESAVIRVCFDHGVKRQHAGPVLKRLKAEGIIDLDFRIPDIKRLDAPRPIRIMPRSRS